MKKSVKAVEKKPFGGKGAPLYAKKIAKPKLVDASVKVVAKVTSKKKLPSKFNARKYEATRRKVFSLPNKDF